MNDFRENLRKSAADSIRNTQDDEQLLATWRGARYKSLASRVHQIAQDLVSGTKLTAHSVPVRHGGESTISIQICDPSRKSQSGLVKAPGFFSSNYLFPAVVVNVSEMGLSLPPGKINSLIPNYYQMISSSGNDRWRDELLSICRLSDDAICNYVADVIKDELLLYARNNPSSI